MEAQLLIFACWRWNARTQSQLHGVRAAGAAAERYHPSAILRAATIALVTGTAGPRPLAKAPVYRYFSAGGGRRNPEAIAVAEEEIPITVEWTRAVVVASAGSAIAAEMSFPVIPDLIFHSRRLHRVFLLLKSEKVERKIRVRTSGNR